MHARYERVGGHVREGESLVLQILDVLIQLLDELDSMGPGSMNKGLVFLGVVQLGFDPEATTGRLFFHSYF